MNTHQYSTLPLTEVGHAPSNFRRSHAHQGILWARVKSLWRFPLHFLIAIGLLVLVIALNGRQFNLTERDPLIQLPDGSTTPLGRYTPLQSDVTTFVSAALVVFRLVGAAWASLLCWHSAFLLMERSGLRRQELDWMISFGVLPPFTYFRDAFITMVGLILLIIIGAQATSPLLAGSIAWIPSSRLVDLQSDAMVSASVVSAPPKWEDYPTYPPRREWTARQAAGLANLAWGRDVEKGVMKRVLQSTNRLNINSTVTNVTLPYFSVTALEWVTNVTTLPISPRDMRQVIDRLSTYGAARSLLLGSGALIPDVAWNSTMLPAISGISETRLLVMSTHWIQENNATGCLHNSSTIFHNIPSSIGLMRGPLNVCYAFARVQYSAGAGICNTCRVSSTSVVQNDTALIPQQDAMTLEALRLMADTSDILAQMNSSIPFSWEGDMEDYISAVLSRSYSGAWTALTNYIGRSSVPLQSSVFPSLPSLRAQVDLRRVYAWFGIQVLSTICGLIYLGIQIQSKMPPDSGTALSAFELDTTQATTQDGCGRLSTGELLKLELEGDGWKVIVGATNKL